MKTLVEELKKKAGEGGGDNGELVAQLRGMRRFPSCVRFLEKRVERCMAAIPARKDAGE